MKLKKKIQNFIIKSPTGRVYEAKRRVKRNHSQYLQKQEVLEGEQYPDNRINLVESYIKKWPNRFLADRDKAKKLVKSVPAYIGTGTEEELFSRLMFYRLAYGFLPEEYVCYELGKKSVEERRKFVSAKECYEKTFRMNDELAVEIFNNKGKTYERFKKYYQREAVYIEKQRDIDKYRKFVKANPVFVKKSVYEAMGRSVELIDMSAPEMDADAYFEKLIRIGPHLLEERVIQSPKLAAFNESSVNTVRCITFYTRSGVVAPYYFMKVGRSGSFVDNGGAGGILVGIDAETGKLCTDGFDECNRRYEVHPDSGVPFKEYQLPQWTQMKNMCIEMSSQIPDVKYIGWDMTHTKDGWVVVEGNGRSQMIGPQTVFKRGIKSEVEELMSHMDLVF